MSVDHLIEEGKLLLQGGKVPDAIAKWQQALMTEPRHPEAQELIRQARTSKKLGPGERTQSLRAFTEGLQDTESSRRLADEKLKQGVALMGQGQIGEAVKSLEAARELDPSRAEIQQILERAIEQFAMEERIDDIYREGLTNLQAGQFTEALTKFLRVLAVDDGHAGAKAALAKAKDGLASGVGTPVPAGDPRERARELFRAGVEAYKRADLREAVRVWKEVIELDPEHPRAAKYCEKALAQLGGAGGAAGPAAPAAARPPGPSVPASPDPFQWGMEAPGGEAAGEAPDGQLGRRMASDASLGSSAPVFDFHLEMPGALDVPTAAEPAPRGVPHDPRDLSGRIGDTFANLGSSSSEPLFQGLGDFASAGKDPFGSEASVFDGLELSLDVPGSTPSEPSFAEEESVPPEKSDAEISLVAADFLPNVRAFASDSKEPPPAWLTGGDEPDAETEPASSADQLVEEGKRAMAGERYEEAVHNFKRALEISAHDSGVRGSLERAVQCLGAREQISSLSLEAERAAQAEDWETAGRVAGRVLHFNPYLRRAQQIATDANQRTRPAHAAAGSEGGASPVINPFAVKKPVNPLTALPSRSGFSSRVPAFALLAAAVIGGGFYAWQARQEAHQQDEAQEQAVAIAQAKRRQESQRKAEQAITALRAGELVQSRDLLEAAAKADPENAALADQLKDVQGLIDKQIQPFVDQAQDHLDRSQYEQALAEVARVLAQDPRSSAALAIQTSAARYRAAMGSPDEKLFRITNFQKFLERGHAALAKNDLEGARQLYSTALELKPRDSLAEEKLAVVTGRLAELRKVRAREGEMLDEADRLLATQKYRPALERYEHILAAVPDSARAKEGVANAQAALRRQREAEVHKKLTLQHYKLGNENEALSNALKWLELEPDSREAKFYINELQGAGN
jgi:tetratricopeptide (TPR) repeat protein